MGKRIASVSELRRHDKYERLVAAARQHPPLATAVAHPCDETSLRGTVEAFEAGLVIPTLIGPARRVREVASRCDLDIGRFEIIDVAHSQAAASKAVELVRTGKARLLMKGSLHSDE